MTVTDDPKWTIYTGDDRDLDYTVKDANGNPIDCTTATAIEYRMRVINAAGQTVTIAKSLGSGITIVQPGGKPRVTLAGGDTIGLPDQTADDELDIVLGGKRSTVSRGKVRIVRSLAEPSA